MKELIVQHEFNLQSNMEEVKSSIAETIAKYDVVVVEDRLGEAKELMATFNKEKKSFSDKCKGFLGAITAPLEEFKRTQKEIEQMYDNGREKIKQQVEAFEAKKLEDIKQILTAYKDQICTEKGINPQSVTVDDLIKLSAVNTNKSGYSIAKATAETIDLRIQTVENEILKARLEAEEKAKRDREIAEKARLEAEEQARKREIEQQARFEREKQEAVERAKLEQQRELEAERSRMEQEARAKVEAEQRQKQAETPKEVSTPTPTPQSEPQPQRDDGKRVFIITATFEVLAPDQTPFEMIQNKLKGMIEGAGITSLKTIEVR